MNILIVNTGDDKLDQAYKNIQVHISTFDTFEGFYPYFVDIVKTDDHEKLNKWLLKVLFVELKFGRNEVKHDFDILLESLDAKNKNNLSLWLNESLNKLNKEGGKHHAI